ncbi:MAG: CYTH domain-containing protein [Thioalkalivibrionaceae bacterium]
MPVEIERKYLLKNDTWRQNVSLSQEMSQGYLCGNERASIRVRIAGADATLNIKSATLGIERLEYGYALPLNEARELLERLAGAVVEKTRHHVEVDGVLFEIDEFHGANAGLIVAEVELPCASSDHPRPDWLGVEVSHDPRFYNTELARVPFSRWPDREKWMSAATDLVPKA